MKVAIDISLLTATEAIGRIHGAVNLSCTPSIGSDISFLYPKVPAALVRVEGFSGSVRVSSLQFAANNDSDGVLALLEDIVVATREDGLRVATFLQEGFGLLLEEYA
jgi:hypothetical protein